MRAISFFILIFLTTFNLEGKESRPFISESRELVPQQEWNREIIASSKGSIWCNIDNKTGSMDIILVAARSYFALMANNPSGMYREDVIYQSYSFSGKFFDEIEIPQAGSYWFIVKNDTNKNSTISLKCEMP